MFGVAVMFAYVAMGAVRLARFNATVSPLGQQIFYRTRHSGGGRGDCVVGDFRSPHHSDGGRSKADLVIVTFVLAFLMVSTIKYRSFKDMKFRGRQHFTYLVWGILALLMVAAWPQAMLFVTFAGYALSGPIERLVGMLTKWRKNQRRAGSANKVLAAMTRSSKQRFGKRMLKAVISKAADRNISESWWVVQTSP